MPLTRIVIAGGPGAGKSTLLQSLADAGEVCFEECSRVLIREQLSIAGRLVPWDDLPGFAQECGRRMVAQISAGTPHRFSVSTLHRRCFFDRGLPDLAGYLRRGGHDVPEAWLEASRAYSRTVFFVPPWREIYVHDAERQQSFAEASALSEHIRDAYEDYGFRLLEIVKGTVAERRTQILDYVKLHPGEFAHE